ncbi:MAG TPA: hypothetical protein VJT77_08930 [Burkholderiales bacterium]|nr:hypothetical protein [Burkholderiales bacterium]
MSALQAQAGWYRDPAARRFLALGYLPWLAALSLAWEVAQLPLYTIWRESSAGYIAFAVVHCTLGDLMIGSAALALALIAGRERALARWHWPRITIIAALTGTLYTAFSEWLNVAILRSWAYSEWMPVIEIAGLQFGASPLLQWLVIPTLALYLARKGDPLWKIRPKPGQIQQ